jgi:hypothetical protein
LALQIGVSNFCFTRLRLDETITFIFTSFIALCAVFTRNDLLFFIGLILFLVSLGRQYLESKKLLIEAV